MHIPVTCTLLDDRAILAYRRADKLRRWRNAHPTVRAWANQVIAYEKKMQCKLTWAELYTLAKDTATFKRFQNFHYLNFVPKNRAVQSDILLFRGQTAISAALPATTVPASLRGNSSKPIKLDDPNTCDLIEEDLIIKERRLITLDWDSFIEDPATFPAQAANDQVPPDPAEDTGDYTKTDPGNRITLDSSSEVTVTAGKRSEDWRLLIDHSANYWSGDWNWRFDTVLAASSTKNGIAGPATLTNSDDDLYAIDVAGGDYQGFWLYEFTAGVSGRLSLTECAAGTLSFDSYTINVDTRRWVDFERDDDGGGGGNGRLTALVYSDTYTTLEETLTNDLVAKVDFRYANWVTNYNSGSAEIFTGEIDNLDFQGGAPSVGVRSTVIGSAVVNNQLIRGTRSI